MMKIYENFDNIEVHSDSDSSVKLVQQCHNAIALLEFVSHKSYDFIKRIWPYCTNSRRVRKIKAHVDLSKITDLTQCYHSLGNKLANDEAIIARDNLLPPVVRQCQELHADYQSQEALLTQFYEWILVLQTAKSKADKSGALTNISTDVETKDKLQQAIFHYQAANIVCQEQVDDRWLGSSVWGLQVTMACVDWMLSCKWPNDDTEPGGYKLGLSWSEMAIAVSLHFGNWLPIKRHGNDEKEYIFQPLSHQDAMHNGVTLAEITKTATHLWQHVRALTPTLLVPKVPLGKVKSLNMQGSHPPSNYLGGVGATHFVRGPTPPSYKMCFPSLQNGNAAQTPYKMAVPSPPLGLSKQHVFLTRIIEPFCRAPTPNKKIYARPFSLTIFDPSCRL